MNSVTDDGRGVSEAIRKGTAIVVSDRLLKNNREITALITEEESLQGRIWVVNQAPGHCYDQNSRRWELTGIYGIICGVKEICNYHKI